MALAPSDLELLATERAAFVAAVHAVPHELRARRIAAGGWSVNEVIEHLARVEKGIARLLEVRGRETPGADAVLPARVDVRTVRDRSRPIEAPERIRPTGQVDTVAALEALAATRAALLAAVAAADPASLDGISHDHPVLGPMPLRDWIPFVAHHEARHAQQVIALGMALLRDMASTGEVHPDVSLTE